MKKFVVLAALIAFTPAVAQDVMTNDAVRMLAQAGLGEQTLIAKIKGSPNSFDVSAPELIALKKAGLSDAVIASMIDAAARSSVATPMAMGSSDSPDPRLPHASGIYLLDEQSIPARMVRMDATSSNQTKSGGFLAYALTSGIAKMKINTVVAGAHARVVTPSHHPKFYFFFDQASISLSDGAPSGFWSGGPASAVTSPNEFSLVRFSTKKDRREAAIGSFNIGGAKAGVQDSQRVSMTYKDVRPGVFEVTAESDLTPGEYGFIYSTSTGQGTGIYSGGATMSRIFDFSVLSPA